MNPITEFLVVPPYDSKGGTKAQDPKYPEFLKNYISNHHNFFSVSLCRYF